MNIIPRTMTINQLLGSRCQFSIPRFQRDYSWELTHYQEFIEDMLDCLDIDEGQISGSSYFLGTMLFIGSLDRAGQRLDVVDGQQRLTTMTILFSAISDHFISDGKEKLSERIFDYIMTEDDNGEKVKILVSETSYPFFQYFIQDRKKSEVRLKEANSEEEECIKNAFDYLYERTSEEELKRYLMKKYGEELVGDLQYEDILKAVRDQVLNCTVVAICTTDKKDANRVFEILNAKGKKLASVDLIKNKIFDIMNQEEPVDVAEDKWNEIKEHLYSGKNTAGLTTYFRHYWVSKYSKSSEVQLYDSFTKKIVPQTSQTYNAFLDDLVKNAKYYSQIINPKREDYNNKKQYYGIVQSLKILTDDFNVVQTRSLLLALFDARNRNVLKEADFRDLVYYLEEFHFAYNTLLSGRANVLDHIYTSHARMIRKCNSTEEIRKVISRLRKALSDKHPSFQDFKDRFITLKYTTRREDVDNIKTKYVINKLNCFYSDNGQRVFSDEGSIEHIIPESSGEYALNVGNLILLEIKLNSLAGEKSYSEKRRKVYRESSYKWINKFVDSHQEWTQESIETRAEKMAEIFYYDVLKLGIRVDTRKDGLL